MNETDAWNAFWKSGSIYEYLMYKCIHNDTVEDNYPGKEKNEIYNERTDNQRTEYR